MIYLDSNAIVKLVAPEVESAALQQWLSERSPAGLFTSKLAEVEVPRALRRSQPGVLGSVAAVLRYLDRVEINDVVRATAAAYVDPHLRSLDAIHLATAQAIAVAGKVVTDFVTYDKRLARAATEAGLTIAAPGAS